MYTFRLDDFSFLHRSAAVVNGIAIEGFNGHVTVTATSDSLLAVKVIRFAYGRDSADAAATLALIEVRDTLAGDIWHVRAQDPGGRRPLGCGYEAAVRAKTATSIRTSNGHVSVTGITDAVEIRTSNGNITAAGCDGDLSASSSNGKLAAQVHRGGTVSLVTTNGRVECDLALLQPGKPVSINTTNGDVAVLLPVDASVLLDVTTSSGDIVVSGFTVQYEQQSRTRVRGRIGSGATTVTIVTSNADVAISPRH